jgi:hypothetical protein
MPPPPSSLSAVGTIRDNGFSQAARDFSQDSPDLVQAHGRIGIHLCGIDACGIEPGLERVRYLDGDGQMLVLVNLSRERPQGTQHAIPVDDLNVFVHGSWPIQRNGSVCL